MKQDFPAAHSMDTQWFAIDGEGRVAIFETGESGAVPTEAYREYLDFPNDFIGSHCLIEGRLLVSAWPGEWIMQRALASLPAPDMAQLPYDCNGVFELSDDAHLPMLFGSTTLDEVPRDLFEETSLVRFAGPRPVYAASGCLADQVRAAAAAGKLRDFRLWPQSEDSWRDSMNFWEALFGFYRFSSGRYGSGIRYERDQVPLSPVKIADYPADLTEKMLPSRRATYDFSASEVIYPSAHALCSYYRPEGDDILLACDQAGQVAVVCGEGHKAGSINVGQLVDAYPRGADGIVHLPRQASAFLPEWMDKPAISFEQKDAQFVMCVLRNDEVSAQRFAEPDFTIFRFAGDLPVYLSTLSRHYFDLWPDKKNVLHVWPVTDAQLFSLLGFYQFTSDGPQNYLRSAVPRQPCTLDDLPPLLRQDALVKHWQGLRFDQCEVITPAQMAAPDRSVL
jgi:hypothetical protein